MLHEGDEPDALAHLSHPDVLASEDLAEVDLAAQEGAWALLTGVLVAAVGFITAEIGWCPINSLLGKDTHTVDPDWAVPHGAH